MDSLCNLDNTALKLLVIELREKLAKSNSRTCESCVNFSETIDSLTYQVEEFEKERVELRKAVKDLSLYLQVEAG